MNSEKMMRIVSELEELNKAVRAPNDASGCTARLIHMAEDERMTLAPLVKIRERRINRVSSGTMRRRQSIQWYDASSKVGQGRSRSQDSVE